jgi:putative ABC transport system permease protein
MDTLRQDLRYALRALNARRWFTLIATLTLALGIGATTAIFSVVRGVLLRPLPYAHSDALLMVWQADAAEVTTSGHLLSHPNFLDVRAQVPAMTSIAQVGATNLTVTEPGPAQLISGGRVSTQFFQVFGATPVLGREFSEEEDRFRGPAVAIISHAYWQEALGARADVLGSSIRINGTEHQIVGVAPPGFDYPSRARIWIPIQNNDEGCGRGCVTRGAVARLAPGASVEQARTQLRELATRLEAQYPETNTQTTMTTATLHEMTVGEVRNALLILLGAVGMVLLIACANVANLLLVRGRARSMEIAVRSTLGADRGRIVSQLLSESALLAILGGILGIVLASWGVALLRAIAPQDLPRLDEIRLDGLTLLFAGALAVLTVLMFGLMPALHVSRMGLSASLRMGGRSDVSGGGRSRGRSLILVGEVALSVMLLLGAGLLVRSFVRMQDIRPGYEAAGITQFRLSLPAARYPDPGDAVRFMDALLERLRALPGVEQASVMVAAPLSDVTMFSSFERTDRPPPPPGEGPGFFYRIVDEATLELLRIPILSGRGFLPTDRHGSEPVTLISKLAADRYFPGEDPVGKLIRLSISAGYEEPDDAPRRIVGVFADVRGNQLSTAPEPEVWIPYAQSGAGFPNVLVRGRIAPARILEAARGIVQQLDAELPLVRPGVMDDFVAAQLARPRFYLLLLGLFAILAVVLAAVGLYGVVAYAVAQRTREIGLRVALGARARQVVNLVLWQGVRPAVLGLLLGLAGAAAAGRIVRGLLFEVEPGDPVTFALVPVVLLSVVVLACALPALRAVRIAPSSALRHE